MCSRSNLLHKRLLVGLSDDGLFSSSSDEGLFLALDSVRELLTQSDLILLLGKALLHTSDPRALGEFIIHPKLVNDNNR